MAALDSLAELTANLEAWDREQGENGNRMDPLPALKRLSELLETETEAYYKMDPDPFDDRHPARSNPTCALGHMMRTLFKNEQFMRKLLSKYVMSARDQFDLQCAALRLVVALLPGLDRTVLVQEEGLIPRLYQWAETAEDPLCIYSCGVLAGAMDLQEVASSHKDKDTILVPIMLRRLHDLNELSLSEDADKEKRHFAMFAAVKKAKDQDERKKEAKDETPAEDGDQQAAKKIKLSVNNCGDCSTSSWAEMESFVIGTYSLSPLTIAMKQRLILQYLTPLGEYSEFSSMAFEHNAMDLIFHYIDLTKNQDGRLAFEALRYLSMMLCHKKFATEFVHLGGVQKLLEVYRPSIPATGVSLCLYYVAYFEDIMERVCLLPEQVLTSLVSYMLWLLECSHDSSRLHAAMFFSQAFAFKIILDIFNQKDGLRRLFNVISTLEILNSEHVDHLSEDQIFFMQQAARNVCVALKKYFDTHMAIKISQLIRSHTRHDGGSPYPEAPSYKVLKIQADMVQDNMELMLELMPVRTVWQPEATFRKLGGIQLLTKLLSMSVDWNNYSGRAETTRSALDVVAVCTVMSKSQLTLLETVQLAEDVRTPALSIFIRAAEGEVCQDADVQKSALNVIINCVCGPLDRQLSGGVGRLLSTGTRKRVTWRGGDDVLGRMWNGVRANNGIMALLKLLTVKTPITDADSIRAHACKAILGLSRSETMKQIISKLPLFNNGLLQQLIKEPVLQDKRQEHIKFCKYACELTERVTGKSSHTNIDASLDEIRRANIVAQTKIIFQEKELLGLIHSHLVSKGLADTASVLLKEASLPSSSIPAHVRPLSPQLFSPAPKLSRQLNQSTMYSAPGANGAGAAPSQGRESVPSTPGTSGPIRFTLGRPVNNSPSTGSQSNRGARSKVYREKIDLTTNDLLSPSLRKSRGKGRVECEMSLEKIVTEYLRKQHALCRIPVLTCPSMSLFTPHRCPEPRHKNCAPLSITSRLCQRACNPPFGGIEGAKCDRKFVYGRFRPITTYKDADAGFSCCAFTACDQNLIIGTYAGDLKYINIQTGEELSMYHCHSAPISRCHPSQDGKLLLTSNPWGNPLSALWAKLEDSIENKLNFEDDNYVEFSKVTPDKIVGTKEETAQIYDTCTGQVLMKLFDADKANFYKTNQATFSPTDDLVLNDGILWDINSRKSIHKFDKLNSHISGVFHPLGQEVIINSEVWDLRTFRLLHTVPALDQCQIRFNHCADVIYGAIHLDDDLENNVERYRSPFGSTFRTFDATDYSSIATIDVKSSIYELCTDKSDCYLAVVECQEFQDTTDESVCKLYEVGKLRDEEEEQTEDEDDGPADDDDDDDDDDDGDDDDDEFSGELELASGDDNDNDDDDDDEDNDNSESDGDDGSYDDTDNDVDLDDDILFELSGLSDI